MKNIIFPLTWMGILVGVLVAYGSFVLQRQHISVDVDPVAGLSDVGTDGSSSTGTGGIGVLTNGTDVAAVLR